ncbi:DUF3310 domain-containing protein [Aureimonas ureilytica]|uniref:DUF3310 domain-containing protein n=1 Tax=Aureimonas ureilytica TaxID=401562 RepID=UPI00036254FB|nr:DUF3310 domain-containing protein [Aureimonas ureilytica]
MSRPKANEHTDTCDWHLDQYDKECTCGAVARADAVNHPSHYTSHPSGVECIDVTEHMTFNLGNAVKYVWRAGLKSVDPIQDLQKAAWYINREIDRLKAAGGAA